MVVVVALSITAKQRVVFLGSYALGYDDAKTVKIPATSFSNLQTGDVVTMVVESDAWCKFIIGGDYNTTKEANSTDKKFQFEVTDDYKSKLQANGLYVQGNPTLLRVQYGSEATPAVLYTNEDGYQIEAGWTNTFDAFNDYDFSNAAVGDVLTFTVECTATQGDWHPLAIRSTDDYKVFCQYNTYNQTTLTVTVDADLLAVLKGNCQITGDQFKLKGISYQHEDYTYVLNAAYNGIDLSAITGTADVELIRKYDWNTTICLPFDVDNVSTAFGNSTKAYEFKEYNDGLVFTEREHLEAGKPYFMTFDMTGIDEADKTVTKTFEDVTINTTLNNSATSGGLTFKGNYTPGIDMEGNYGVACVEESTNNWVWGFYKGGTGSKLNAFSAYFEGSIPSSNARLAIIFDNETTGINSPISHETTADTVYYNLAGQRMANVGKGLYIVNGKKMIIK